MTQFRCGDVVVAEDKNAHGHMQQGKRYWLIVSNNVGNAHAPIYNAIPFTTKKKNMQPTHVRFQAGEGGLPRNSTLLCELETPIEKANCVQKVGQITEERLTDVAKAIAITKPIGLLAFQAGIQDTKIFQRVLMA